MESGLGKTLQVLTKTRNEAALGVLIAGLESSNAEMRTACLRALLDRRSNVGHRAILGRWHTFDETWKQVVAEKATRIEGALRSAILSIESELHQNACDAVVYLHGYDFIPALITAAEDKGNTQAPLAARAVISLCELLFQELSAQRDYRLARDPVLVRQFIFAALEKAVAKFEHHRRAELVEAFLLLAQPDDAPLKLLLQNQFDSVHAAVVTLMTHSQRQGVMQLLLRCMDELHALPAIITVVTRRTDLVFLRMLFRKFVTEPVPRQKANWRKIEGFAWLREDLHLLQELADEELQGAVQVILACGINRLRVFEVLKMVMKHGGPASRRAASAALVSFKGGEANELVLGALDDPDPFVQANAVRQLRDRGIPGVMPRLVELMDNPQEVVRNAAKESLSEFNFQRYLSAFDMLDSEVRRCSGSLVMRIDPHALEQLQVELTSTSRSRRLRGIEVAIAMGVVPQVEAAILQLAQDNDHFVRAEAARALVQSDSDQARHTLDELLNDRSVSVMEAAQESIGQLNMNSPGAPPSPPLPKLDPTVVTVYPTEPAR